MKQREDKRCGGAVVSARHKELERNRARLLEIKSISTNNRNRIHEMLKYTGPNANANAPHHSHFSKL